MEVRILALLFFFAAVAECRCPQLRILPEAFIFNLDSRFETFPVKIVGSPDAVFDLCLSAPFTFASNEQSTIRVNGSTTVEIKKAFFFGVSTLQITAFHPNYENSTSPYTSSSWTSFMDSQPSPQLESNSPHPSIISATPASNTTCVSSSTVSFVVTTEAANFGVVSGFCSNLEYFFTVAYRNLQASLVEGQTKNPTILLQNDGPCRSGLMKLGGVCRDRLPY